MGEMAAALAHQIRTPLSSALLYVSNLGASQLDAVRRKRFISKTMSALQHLEILVEEMLLFARGGRLNASLADPVTVINEFIAQQTEELEDSKLNITVNNELENVLVNLSTDAFKSSLQNLLNNACQASEGITNIFIELVYLGEESIQIKVIDDGPGIPDSIKPHLFEPFVTTRTNGTGLGLAVVDAVVRAHKGKIMVNDAPGKGTCFTITLPVYKDKNIKETS